MGESRVNMQNNLKDHQLLEALQSGEALRQEQVFRQLYRQYYGLIESMVLRHAGQKEDVKDIFHDALIVFFNKAKQSEFQLSSTIKTYLYAVCRNLWMAKQRKTNRESSIEDHNLEVAIEASSLETLEISERKSLIRQLLQQLGEECQQILELYYFRKMRIVQIQQQLQMTSEQVVKNKKGKCLKRVRQSVMDNRQYQQMLR